MAQMNHLVSKLISNYKYIFTCRTEATTWPLPVTQTFGLVILNKQNILENKDDKIHK